MINNEFHYVPSSTQLLSNKNTQQNNNNKEYDINDIIQASIGPVHASGIHDKASNNFQKITTPIKYTSVNKSANREFIELAERINRTPLSTTAQTTNTINSRTSSASKPIITRRLRTNSFNQNSLTASNHYHHHLDQDSTSGSSDTESKTAAKKSSDNAGTDLKTSIIRLISGKHKLSPSQLDFTNHQHYHNPKRSHSIKMQKSLDEKEELIFRFKKNRSVSHSYSHHNRDQDNEDDDDDDDDGVLDDEDYDEAEEEEYDDQKVYSKSYEDPSAIKALFSIQNENNNNAHNNHENKSLLSRACSVKLSASKSQFQIPNSDTTSSASSSSSSGVSSSGSPNCVQILMLNHHHKSKGENNNTNLVILNDDEKAEGQKPSKRSESIRMRHPSNANLLQNDSNNRLNEKNESRRKRLFRRVWKGSRSNQQNNHQINKDRKHNVFIIFILFVVNLLNYIDRFTLAGT
jgi:hypothetical protein